MHSSTSTSATSSAGSAIVSKEYVVSTSSVVRTYFGYILGRYAARLLLLVTALPLTMAGGPSRTLTIPLLYPYYTLTILYDCRRDPKPFPPPMKLCKEMVEAMGGADSKLYGTE